MWQAFTLLCYKFTHDNTNQILSESVGFCGRYDKDVLVCFFCGLQCTLYLLATFYEKSKSWFVRQPLSAVNFVHTQTVYSAINVTVVDIETGKGV